jgi:hypothetical protein
MKTKSIPALNKKNKLVQVEVKYDNVPHTELMVHPEINSQDDPNPRYMIAHRHSGWGILLAPVGTSKKKTIAAAQHLWAIMPDEIKKCLIVCDTNDGYTVQAAIQTLMHEDKSIKPAMKSALRSTRNYLSSGL